MSYRHAFLVSIFFTLACATILCQSFTPTDKLLILVTGFPASTTKFGYSGKATLYRAIATSIDGSIQFDAVSGAQKIDVERNSAKDFANKANYGTNGFIPPGIYFLHYHKLDPSLGQVRHRLGLSDDPGGETIRTAIPTPPVTRTAIQFHKAFNDLASFSASVSEGCITLTEDKFFKLFPSALFIASQSPLAAGKADSNPLSLSGATNNVLVFVTNAVEPGKQSKQIMQFEDIRKKLKAEDFTPSKIAAYRILWR